MLCSPNSTVSTINPADAALKFLFADDGHLTTAGQEIVGDYFFCLLYERLVKAGGTTIGNPPLVLDFPKSPPRPDCENPSNFPFRL